MTIEDKLKNEILSQYKSLRAFTQYIAVPYSTIDTMLKKGFAGTSVSTVIKVCNALTIDINALEYEEIKRISQETITYSKPEQELIANFNQLNPLGQQTLLVQSNMMKENPMYKKINLHNDLQNNA